MTKTLAAENICELSHVRHAFFTKAFGNGGYSSQEATESLHASRERMAAHLHVAPQNLISAYQLHSPDVVVVTDLWDADHRPKADAMVTDRAGIALGILTADCVPVLFADKNARVIGAAHAGWRGAIGGVLENTVKAMEAMGAGRQTIYAALGPCIWQKSYEVSDEFLAPFITENIDNAKFFRPGIKSGHCMFDLPGYVEAKLRRLGLAAVQASPADTCADPETFYSHRYSTLRNEKRNGNLMSAIVLAD